MNLLPEELKSFDWYVNKVPQYLKTDDNFLTHFKNVYDLCMNVNNIGDKIINSLDIDAIGLSSALLDMVGGWYGINRTGFITATNYVETEHSITGTIAYTLTNDEMLTLIKFAIAKRTCGKTVKSILDTYSALGIDIAYRYDNGLIFVLNDVLYTHMIGPQSLPLYYKYTPVIDAMFEHGMLTPIVAMNQTYEVHLQGFRASKGTPFYFEALEDATIVARGLKTTPTYEYYVYENGVEIDTGILVALGKYTIDLKAGQIVTMIVSARFDNSRITGTYFQTTGKLKVYGNLMALQKRAYTLDLEPLSFEGMFANTSIVDASGVVFNNVTSEDCYKNLFGGSALEDASFILPAKVVADGAYESMFDGCTKLKNAPTILAEEVGSGSMSRMFAGSGIETAPELNVVRFTEDSYSNMSEMFADSMLRTAVPELKPTNCTRGCYSFMYSRCKRLKTSSIMRATSCESLAFSSMYLDCISLKATVVPVADPYEGLASSHQTMFQGCRQLSKVTVNFTTWSGALFVWLDNVAKIGTFYCSDDLDTDVSRGGNSIPENWTIKKWS